MSDDPKISHSLQLTELLDSQREAASTTDVVLVCGGKDFPAHKMILCATSTYFRAMFSAGWNENNKNRIEMPSVTAEEMEIILPFLYTGKIKEADNQHLLEALLETSHALQINGLFKHSYKKLSESLNCDNFLGMCNLALHYNEEGMNMAIFTFLAQHFQEVSVSEEFLQLNACQMQKICQHPHILKSSMDVLINGLLRWAEVEGDRENVLLEIISKLNLQRMSTAYLAEILRGHVLVKKDLHILTLFTAEATSRMLISSLNNLEIHNEPKLLTFGRKDDHHICRVYDVKQNHWSLSKSLPFHLTEGMSTVWFGGYVYFFGGGERIKITPSATVIKYCPATNTVASLNSILVPVCCAGAGMIYEDIYIVNGVNESSQSISTVQRYNPISSTCEMMAPTNNSYFRPHVLRLDKHLLVVGSIKNQKYIECYNPERDLWTVITTIPEEIEFASAALYEQKLLVAPTRVSSEFQIYDFASSTWAPMLWDAPFKEILGLNTAVIDGKCILLVRDGKKVLHLYDLAAHQWITKSTPNYEPWYIYLTCSV